MGEYHKERVVLETKYQGLLKPLYEQRAAVISGTAAAGEGGGVLAAAADAAGAAAAELCRFRVDMGGTVCYRHTQDMNDRVDETEVAPAVPGTIVVADAITADWVRDANNQLWLPRSFLEIRGEGAGKGIPNFWLTAIQNHELICETISERDEGALAYLTDIRTAFHEDMDGYKLEFEFSVNPYFTNLVLSKSYDVPNFIELDNNPQLAGTEGTEIDWKPGMDLTVEMVTKKVKKKGQRKGRPQTKTVTREEECKSFFNFFSPPDLEEEDDEDEGDEDAYEERAALIDLDFELGMIFSKQVVKGTRHAGGTRGAGGG